MQIYRAVVPWSERHALVDWILAAGLFLLASLLRFWVLPIEAGSAFFTFYPATIAAFFFLRRRPAMTTLLLSTAAGYYFFTPPYFSFMPSRQGLLSAALYVVSCGAIGWIVARLRSATALQQAAVQREQASRKELDAVLAAQTEVIGRVRADGTVLFVNDAYCRQMGVRREDILGQRWQLRVVPEDLPDIERQLAQLSVAQPDVTIENRLVMPDGKVRWYQFANHAEYDAQGRLQVIQAVGRDISERKLLEDALFRKSAEVRELFENAPCGYHALDADGRFVLVNTTQAGWLGSTSDRLVRQRRLAEFLSDEGRRQFADHAAQALSGQPAGPLQVDLVVPGQPPRRVSISSQAGGEELGRGLRTIGVMHDVTDLHLIRQATQALVNEQDAMLQNELVGMLRLREGLVVWCNRTLERMFGHEPGALLNQPLQTLFADSGSPRDEMQRASDAARAGQKCRMQAELQRKDGSRIWVGLMCAPFPGEHGQSLWLMLDITAQKQAERARAQAAQLEAENRHLRELGRVQREFLGSVTHRMRTPLSAILGEAHLVARQATHVTPETQARRARQITASATDLLALVDRVLQQVGSPRSRLALQLETTPVAPLLEAVRDACLPALREHGHELLLQPPAAGLDVVADALRLLQALQALLDNAIRYTPGPGRIELRAFAQGEGQVRIEVQDNGRGIAEQDQALVFEGFHQVGPDSAGRGLGLSLALARQIVQAHGGDIELQSTLGQGSCFALVLPAADRTP